MKKLLSTTAIIGAVAFATSANAADLQVNVGGFLDFQAGYTSDDNVGEAGGLAAVNNANEINFNNDTEVHFTVDGKADNGLEYGAVIELEADIAQAADTADSGIHADKTYLFLQGGFGRVELGGNTGAEEALSVNTSTFASATGGVDGDWYRYTIAPTNFTGLTAPDLALSNSRHAGAIVGGDGANEDATKITYYTPRFAGFQAGVSYIPNTEAVGNTALGEAGYENIWTGGINYSGQFDQVGVKAAVTAIRGSNQGKTTANSDLEGWDAGANLSFAGFTIGGSYGDWQDTSVSAAVTDEEATYWDLGLGYEAGAFSASATYLNSETDSATAAVRDEFSNLVLGVDYKLAPGLVPYAEVSFFDYDGNGAAVANDNNGTVVILGTELSF